MSSPKVTLKELVKKWYSMTTQSDVTRWDEMQAFFAEAAEEGYTSSDLMKIKDHIVRVWCPLTWEEAKKRNPNWNEKSWWQHRKKMTLRTWDKWYGEMKKAEKANGVEVNSPAATAAPADDMPVFDNVEDFMAWKNRGKKMA